jgi:very-short-patch-repair endonuclease
VWAGEKRSKSPFSKGGFRGIFTVPLPFSKRLKEFARELRRNMTDAERRLWAGIKRKQLNGYQFYRQKNIGPYIVDFYCPAAKLIVEIDGGQHYSEDGLRKDAIRDRYLAGLGFTVIRFSDRQVLENTDGVLQSIYNRL